MSAIQSQGISFLPEVIIFNILTRLPVKSICRFKCVCKAWLSIISAPSFVDSHALCSKSQPKLLVAIYRSKSRYLFIGDLTSEQEGSSMVVLRQSVTMPVMKWLNTCRNISPGDSQSVEGLMFSICSDYLIRIANPSTNQCIIFYSQRYQKWALPSVSFGFDPVEGKHKLLESLSFWDCDGYNSYMIKRTEHRVVTVGDDAICWRYVKDGPTIDRRNNGWHEICVNGVIYFTADVIWSSRGIDVWEQCIVAFDVRTESFQAVKLPMNEMSQFRYSLRPWMYIEFEGKVAIVDFPPNPMDFYDTYDSYGRKNALLILEDLQNHVWSLKFFNLPISLKVMIGNPSFPKCKLVGTTLDGKLVFAVFERSLNDLDDDYSAVIQNQKKGVPIYFLFFDVKTGDLRKSEVCFPEGFALTDNVRITVMGHVEKLLAI